MIDTLLVVVMLASQIHLDDVSVNGDTQGVIIQELNAGTRTVVTDKEGTQYIIDMTSRKQYVIYPNHEVIERSL